MNSRSTILSFECINVSGHLQVHVLIHTVLCIAILTITVSFCMLHALVLLHPIWFNQGTEEKLAIMYFLADGDKEGTMMDNVLSLLLAMAEQTPDDTIHGKALNTHMQILQLYCRRLKNWKVHIVSRI